MAALLTPEETAERLRVSPRTVTTWLREGVLPGVKIGHLWRIREDSLEQLPGKLSTMEPGTPPSTRRQPEQREPGSDAMPEDENLILGWIRRNGAGTFHERELYHALKGRSGLRTVAVVRQRLSAMIERGIIHLIDKGERPRRGRPRSPSYEVDRDHLKMEP